MPTCLRFELYITDFMLSSTLTADLRSSRGWSPTDGGKIERIRVSHEERRSSRGGHTARLVNELEGRLPHGRPRERDHGETWPGVVRRVRTRGRCSLSQTRRISLGTKMQRFRMYSVTLKERSAAKCSCCLTGQMKTWYIESSLQTSAGGGSRMGVYHVTAMQHGRFLSQDLCLPLRLLDLPPLCVT